MANGNGWLIGLGGAIGGTVLGGLILRGFLTIAVAERLKNLEQGQEDIRLRILRLEALSLERLARIEDNTMAIKKLHDAT